MEQVQQAEHDKKVDLQRLYVKQQQCKLVRSPQIFKDEWKPEINMEMQINTSMVDKAVYEIVLQITLSVKNQNMTSLTMDVEQAGIFQIQDFTEQEQKVIFATYIPNLLFPYARHVISSLSVKASIPPIMLVPVNFDALYQQQEKNKAQKVFEEEVATLN